MSIENQTTNTESSGEKKITEYIERIYQGEIDPDDITPEKLGPFYSKVRDYFIEQIPSRYSDDSWPIELVADMWNPAQPIDSEDVEKQRLTRRIALHCYELSLSEAQNKTIGHLPVGKLPDPVVRETTSLSASEEMPTPNQPASETSHSLSVEERKKLNGWPASYELAKIAIKEGVDLSSLSREEYASFAIQNHLTIDDSQLRTAPWQRMCTSVEEIVSKNKEEALKITEESDKSFARFCYEMKDKASQRDRFISDNIRVREGTKDSDSWLYFGINTDSNKEGAEALETYKSYVSIKDLNSLTPDRFTEFMRLLQETNYKGDVKIFQDMAGQGIKLNDQIVIHGSSEADARLGLELAENFFGNDLDQKSFGKDEIIDGEKMSYSQILAQQITKAIHTENS
ncbi:hypothetical protein H6784_03255 [Candidatus Nomurabacteria bacterium]|nr:hypothetical protein [Candidatus Nomurabacteria bacterium]MCB9814410.1 hypothetical protein [Candidatus Nomurabacteria bacterium]